MTLRMLRMASPVRTTLRVGRQPYPFDSCSRANIQAFSFRQVRLRSVCHLEREMHTDTVYITSQQYDSIYIYNDKTLDRTKDTVYLRELSTEYRYKLLRDTLRIIETDTIYIPYEVKVADNDKDKSFFPRFGELAKSAFLVVTAALALWVALRNKA